MRVRTIAVWSMAAPLTFATILAVAQQDEGPILRPKPKPVPAATLLVICDLACTWKLDGKPRGEIAAGDSAIAPLSLGQHLVDAATQDGLDKVENEVEIKAAGQTLLRIALQPVRDARLKAEQQARDKADQEARDRDKAAQEARDKAAREQQTREQKERERVAREDAAGVWTDPATRLMWTKNDNGKGLNWRPATKYCQNLRLAGHADWRLPAIDELQAIYDKTVVLDDHVKGKLNLTGAEWSSSLGDAPGRAWTFDFYYGDRLSLGFGDGPDRRALCVRLSKE